MTIKQEIKSILKTLAVLRRDIANAERRHKWDKADVMRKEVEQLSVQLSNLQSQLTF